LQFEIILERTFARRDPLGKGPAVSSRCTQSRSGDALIIRAAVAATRAVVLSEDLQADRVLDGVRVEKPFR
jgi:predicted nucleic acid-binding protein